MREAIWKKLTSRSAILGFIGSVILLAGGLWLIDPDDFPFALTSSDAAEKGPADAAQNEPPVSPAERLARLQRSIESQTKYLDSLNVQLHDPNSEFKRAEKYFQLADAQREEAKQELQKLRAAGKTVEAAAREAALKDLETKWQQNRDRFNLAIKEHKTLQATIAAATRSLEEDRRALARFTGDATRSANATPLAGKTPGANAAPSAASNEAAKATPSVPGMPSLLKLPEMPSAPSGSATLTSAPANPATEAVSREVERAREEAKLKEEAAKKAQDKAHSLTERLDALQENINLNKKLLETARQRVDHEQQTKTELETELRRKAADHAPEAEVKDVSRRLEFAEKRFQAALGEVRVVTDHLHDLQEELNHLQAAQIRALHDADLKKQDADSAEEKIAHLQNPFRPRNMLHWLLLHGPRLFVIAVGMLIFHRLSRTFSRRIVSVMAQGDTSKRGSHQDRENRAQTLVGVFSSALSLVILGGGSLMILDAVGIPIVPLMGGAAVIGLAVAFGAQNLIKDYFSGFMVLLEDQYGINDVVTIGSISGLVEHISLRTTVLRDLEGVVHFIPHGTITTVSNQTHGWSRALFDVDIAYREDIDRAMQVLLELGREIRNDPTFGPLILDDPEMLGVDRLADSSVVVKFFLKTRPLQQWTVKREMLRRIKNRFDQMSIEIPFPHQTVYHRYDALSNVPANPPPQLKRPA